MTYPSVTHPRSISSPRPQRHGAHNVASPKVQAPSSTAHFSGSLTGSVARLGQGKGFTTTIIDFFNKVNTSFFYQLFMLDIVGLMMTRAVSGLVIGREKYEAYKDSARRTRDNWAQKAHALKENFIGLNWMNAGETFIREATTAPGCLLLPSFAYLAVQKHLKGKAQEIKQSEFNQLFDGFINSLKENEASNLSSAKKGGPKTLASTATRFLNELFDTTGQNNTALARLKKLALTPANDAQLDAYQALSRDAQLKKAIAVPEEILKHYTATSGNLATQGKGKIPKTVGEFLTAWTQQWSASLEASQTGAPITRSLKDLSNDFSTLFEQHIQRAYQPEALKRNDITVRLFHRLKQTGDSLSGEIKPTTINTKGLLSNLERFGDFMKQTFRSHAKDIKAGKKATDLIAHAVKSQKQLQLYKLFGTIAALAIGGGWLYLVPKMAQWNKKYPAIRHLKNIATGGASEANPNKAHPYRIREKAPLATVLYKNSPHAPYLITKQSHASPTLHQQAPMAFASFLKPEHTFNAPVELGRAPQ